MEISRYILVCPWWHEFPMLKAYCRLHFLLTQKSLHHITDSLAKVMEHFWQRGGWKTHRTWISAGDKYVSCCTEYFSQAQNPSKTGIIKLRKCSFSYLNTPLVLQIKLQEKLCILKLDYPGNLVNCNPTSPDQPPQLWILRQADIPFTPLYAFGHWCLLSHPASSS